MHCADLANITAPQISAKALTLTFDSRWTSNVDDIRIFLLKCEQLQYLQLQYLQLFDGYNNGQHVRLGELLAAVIPECLPHVEALKIANFHLAGQDAHSIRKCFPNLTALAIDVNPESCTFVKDLLSAKQYTLDILDLGCKKREDMQHLGDISNMVSVREVAIKLQYSMCAQDYEYVLRLPRARKLTVAFLSHRELDLHKGLTSYEFEHPELLYSRYSFGINDDTKEFCDDIVHLIRKEAPWIETLHVAFANEASLAKFGVHERYSPNIEKRALGLMRGANILHDLPEEKTDDYYMQEQLKRDAEARDPNSRWYDPFLDDTYLEDLDAGENPDDYDSD